MGEPEVLKKLQGVCGYSVGVVIDRTGASRGRLPELELNT
jgi:hypothetical protein